MNRNLMPLLIVMGEIKAKRLTSEKLKCKLLKSNSKIIGNALAFVG